MQLTQGFLFPTSFGVLNDDDDDDNDNDDDNVCRHTGKRGLDTAKGPAGGPRSASFLAGVASKPGAQHPKLAALMGLKSIPSKNAAPRVTVRPRSAQLDTLPVRPIPKAWPDHSPGHSKDSRPYRSVLSFPELVPALPTAARPEQIPDTSGNRGPLPPLHPLVPHFRLPAPDALQDEDVFKEVPGPGAPAPAVMFNAHRRAISLSHAPTVVHARGFNAKMTAANENVPVEVCASRVCGCRIFALIIKVMEGLLQCPIVYLMRKFAMRKC